MSIELVPADTTPEAAAVQREIYRRMSPGGRLELACEASDALRRGTVAAGVRSRHPEYDEGMVKMAVIRLMVGDELFAKAFPGIKVQP